jgi:hypothetical protein
VEPQGVHHNFLINTWSGSKEQSPTPRKYSSPSNSPSTPLDQLSRQPAHLRTETPRHRPSVRWVCSQRKRNSSDFPSKLLPPRRHSQQVSPSQRQQAHELGGAHERVLMRCRPDRQHRMEVTSRLLYEPPQRRSSVVPRPVLLSSHSEGYENDQVTGPALFMVGLTALCYLCWVESVGRHGVACQSAAIDDGSSPPANILGA